VNSFHSSPAPASKADRAATAASGRTERAAESPPPHERARIKRLIAGRLYFGLDASVLHAGAVRLLERAATTKAPRRPIDKRALAEDFGVVGPQGSALLTEFLMAGLLQPDGGGCYVPTPLLKEYAKACVVMPLTRERAKALVERVSQLAALVNARWTRNAYRIEAVAVTGSYMSRRNPLDDLSLWIVVRSRFEVRGPRGGVPLASDPDVRKIGAAMKALSSFIQVRVATDRQRVERPFAIVFQADEDALEAPAPARITWWERAVASVGGGKLAARRRFVRAK
jgi:hypothetical protein